jgi:hypothetical protein
LSNAKNWFSACATESAQHATAIAIHRATIEHLAFDIKRTMRLMECASLLAFSMSELARGDCILINLLDGTSGLNTKQASLEKAAASRRTP